MYLNRGFYFNSFNNYKKENFVFYFYVVFCASYIKITKLFCTIFLNPEKIKEIFNNLVEFIFLFSSLFFLFIFLLSQIFLRKKNIFSLNFKDKVFWVFLLFLIFPTINSFFLLFFNTEKENVDFWLTKVVFALMFFVCFFIFFYFLFINKDNKNGLKKIFYHEGFLSKNKILFFWKKIFYYLFILLLVQVCLNAFIKKESVNNNEIETQLSENIYKTIFLVIIVAPICEEIIYRQLLTYASGGYKYNYVLSGILFSIAHWTVGDSFLTILPYLIPGCMLGYIYQKYKNIWFTIVLHFLYNSLALLFFLMN